MDYGQYPSDDPFVVNLRVKALELAAKGSDISSCPPTIVYDAEYYLIYMLWGSEKLPNKSPKMAFPLTPEEKQAVAAIRETLKERPRRRRK
jgi:hypothetical protein